MKSWQAELSLFFVTFIWGATFLFTKLALVDCSPSLFLILRLSVALLLSIIFFGKYLKFITKKYFYQGTLLGILFGVGFLLQTYGLKYTSVSKSAFITGITVSITPFVYWLVKRKKVHFWSKIGVVIATIGLYVFTNPQFDSINIGDLLTLLSTFMWAFYITFIDEFTKGKTGMALTSILVILQFFASALLSVITYFIFDYTESNIHFSNNLLIGLAFNGIMASFVVTFIHTAIQRFTTPVKAALIFSLEPVIANLTAIFFINEILNFREYLGGFLLLSGVVISEIGGVIIRLLKKTGLSKS